METHKGNSDYPHSDALDPLNFPPVKPKMCARTTTRIYDSKQKRVCTVYDCVLVPTSNNDTSEHSLERRQQTRRRRTEVYDTDESSDSSGTDDDGNDELQYKNGRAYLLERTISDALYGKVVCGRVLRRRTTTPDPPLSPYEEEVEWETTNIEVAIKQMSWRYIHRKPFADSPEKEVAAMQFVRQHYSPNDVAPEKPSTTYADDDSNCNNYTNLISTMMEAHVIMPYDLLSDHKYLYSIMPFCDGNELFYLMQERGKFSEDECRNWMDQILKGLETLQRLGICHRDLSLENILVHRDQCLIIDLGMCLRIPKEENERLLIKPQGRVGKKKYMSPEIYQNKVSFDGHAVDMWSAGVILFMMCTGYDPWTIPQDSDSRFFYFTRGHLKKFMEEWGVQLSDDLFDLLQWMMMRNPKERPSLRQVRAHPWMKKCESKG